jgi:hypothetical protein
MLAPLAGCEHTHFRFTTPASARSALANTIGVACT